MNVYDSQDSDWVVDSSILTISEEIMADENISDRIPETSPIYTSAPILTTAPIYSTEMISFDDYELPTVDEIIRYSDAEDYSLLFSNDTERYEYYQENHDFYDYYDFDDKAYSHSMHLNPDYLVNLTISKHHQVAIFCSPITCDVTEWISKDNPAGTGDHERFK